MKFVSSPPTNQFQAAEPSEDGVFQAQLSNSTADPASAKPPRRSATARIVLLLLFFCGVAAPAVWFWLPSEQAKWRVAAARAKWLEGDLSAALQILDTAAVEFPDAPEVYLQRADFLLESEQFDKALADVDKLVKLSPNSPDALGLKSQVLHHLGRHDEAIEVCKEILRLADEEWIGSAAFARNSLAYAYAIGDIGLEQALEHINEAIRLAGNDPALLDTRGFVLYRMGKSESAREDIESAVAKFEEMAANLEAYQRSRVSSFDLAQQRITIEHSLAVMLYHRALVYDRIGMRSEATVDRERVRTLGFEPNEKLF